MIACTHGTVVCRPTIISYLHVELPYRFTATSYILQVYLHYNLVWLSVLYHVIQVRLSLMMAWECCFIGGGVYYRQVSSTMTTVVHWQSRDTADSLSHDSFLVWLIQSNCPAKSSQYSRGSANQRCDCENLIQTINHDDDTAIYKCRPTFTDLKSQWQNSTTIHAEAPR